MALDLDFRGVIDLWPTQRLFAKDIGVTPQSVNVMHKNNNINHKHWPRMEEKAKERGIKRVTYKKLYKIHYALQRQEDLENDPTDT